MGSRHRSREAALKILYQADILEQPDINRIVDDFLIDNPMEDVHRNFCEAIVHGVLERKVMIDSRLSEIIENWEPDRLGYIERAILRIGLYELLFDADTPDKVAINEAIELSKSYCDKDSQSFVNGVLDRALREKISGK